MKLIELSISILVIFVIVFTLSSDSTSKAVPLSAETSYELLVKQTAFLKVTIKTTPKSCESNLNDPKICKEILPKLPPLVLVGVGSGTFIKHDGKIKLLTAEHVCNENIPQQIKYGGVIITTQTTIKINVSSAHYRSVGIIVKMDKIKDLCLVELENPPKSIVPAEVSTKSIIRGEYVSYAGAPHGMMSDNFMLVFDGIFSGYLNDSFMFSLPCARGASGSSIRNKRGKIISMVQRVHIKFRHICYGASTKDILEFLDH